MSPSGQLLNSLKTVENKQDYLARVQVAVQQLHNCGAVHRETVPVKEVFQGETIWLGNVEVTPKRNVPTPGATWTVRKMSEPGSLPC